MRAHTFIPCIGRDWVSTNPSPNGDIGMKLHWQFAFSALFLVGCSCVKTKIPIHGKLGPYVLETTVDSKIAAYYVENYLAGKRADATFDAKLDSIQQKFADIVPDREALKNLSHEYSVDFASLFWAHQLLSVSKNGLIQERFVENMDAEDSLKFQSHSAEYSVILVPGLDYKKSGHLTGSDLKTQVELLNKAGIKVHFVDIPPLGAVEENAAVIADTIRAHSGEQILVGGPSSAGPAIQFALSRILSPKETENVDAWVNLGGIVNGSPVLDWMDSGITYPLWRIIVWSQHWPYESLESMRADVSRKRSATLKVPEHIKVINYIGLSLSGNISKFGMDKYCIMRSQGPNDGLGLLPEMVVSNSYTIIAPYSDHFFAEDPLIRKKTVALFNTVIGLL